MLHVRDCFLPERCCASTPLVRLELMFRTKCASLGPEEGCGVGRPGTFISLLVLGEMEIRKKNPTNAYLAAQVCSVVLTLGHISDFSRHVPDLVTLSGEDVQQK